MKRLVVHGATHPGRVHPKNEDSHVIVDDETAALIVLCDGMGGMGRGDQASQLAVAEIVRSFAATPGDTLQRLAAAIGDADQEIRRVMNTTGEGWAGSTAALVRVEVENDVGTAFVAWAGDSRAYLLRGGRVVERTRDHKLVQELIDSGQLTEQEARRTSLSSVITRALGGRPPGSPSVVAATLAPWPLHPEDRIVLCSDGLCDLVDDDEIAEIVGREHLDRAAAMLIDLANERGGHDNITVVIAAWDATFGPPLSYVDQRGRQAVLAVAIGIIGLLVAWAVHAVRTGSPR